MIKRICTLVGIAGVLAVFGAESPAQAAFPGANGKIAFSDFQLTGSLGFSDYDVYTMEPDGTGTVNPRAGSNQDHETSGQGECPGLVTRRQEDRVQLRLTDLRDERRRDWTASNYERRRRIRSCLVARWNKDRLPEGELPILE